ncbi:hypothetical protein Pst134EA_025689 [Puccinia striiformis f. sp. tritici]|uniref:hypothetical protein n=1 Tax=Puccinia striiformis f. sp. tritici TaxID=168172 RepID=UPI002007A012|nr:hypothetical protein Pst134EA_025689 [Puccinia striiformis f. sp. tritici]KAH9451751.1 hypothetical protein Pst134EA_025689 [Puccinia striiformis f. sp. tritici]KAI9618500.1 hypothetical protein H4Q26_012321 [Puccinia striiformis f. sp. tritici PST-130]
MQHFPSSSNSSYYARGYLGRSERDEYPSNVPVYGDPGMLLSSSNSGMYERNRAPPTQDAFSLGLSPSSIYRGTSGYMANPSEAATSRLLGQMGIENQFDFMSRNCTQETAAMPLDFSTNLQRDFDDDFLQNSSPGDLGNSTQSEDNSASISPARRSPKLYTCEICEKKFVRPSSLTTHRFSHTGEKPHTCPTCGKSFSVASNLRRHEMTIHGPRASNSGVPYYGMTQTTSGGLQSASLVRSTSSSVIYQRGSETYENILPSYERFYGANRGSHRGM